MVRKGKKVVNYRPNTKDSEHYVKKNAIKRQFRKVDDTAETITTCLPRDRNNTVRRPR